MFLSRVYPTRVFLTTKENTVQVGRERLRSGDIDTPARRPKFSGNLRPSA